MVMSVFALSLNLDHGAWWYVEVMSNRECVRRSFGMGTIVCWPLTRLMAGRKPGFSTIYFTATQPSYSLDNWMIRITPKTAHKGSIQASQVQTMIRLLISRITCIILLVYTCTSVVGRLKSCQAFKWRMFKLCSWLILYRFIPFWGVMEDENLLSKHFSYFLRVAGQTDQEIYCLDHKYILTIPHIL